MHGMNRKDVQDFSATFSSTEHDRSRGTLAFSPWFTNPFHLI
jgi:hypothetical protein